VAIVRSSSPATPASRFPACTKLPIGAASPGRTPLVLFDYGLPARFLKHLRRRISPESNISLIGTASIWSSSVNGVRGSLARPAIKVVQSASARARCLSFLNCMSRWVVRRSKRSRRAKYSAAYSDSNDNAPQRASHSLSELRRWPPPNFVIRAKSAECRYFRESSRVVDNLSR
jgi:hypothetical protein